MTRHFLCNINGGVATISLDRPERKNLRTFESYAELRDWFRDLQYRDDVKAICMQTADFKHAFDAFVAKENRCSGGIDGG